jgi:hypothetical protein
MPKFRKGPLIIGILGALGSFSEEAARAYVNKAGLTTPHIKYLITVENVLTELEKGDVSLGRVSDRKRQWRDRYRDRTRHVKAQFSYKKDLRDRYSYEFTG